VLLVVEPFKEILFRDGHTKRPDVPFDYEKMRRAWHWHIYFQDERQMREKTERRLRNREATARKNGEAYTPVSDLTPDQVIQQALLEIIKYPVQTVAEKSDKNQGAWFGDVYLAKHQDASGQRKHKAPPFVQWPGDGALEWIIAHRKFRMTRSYGSRVLFKIEKPEGAEGDAGSIEATGSLANVRLWLGQIQHRPDGYRVGFPLLSLIPGDNSLKDSHGGEEQLAKEARAGPGGGISDKFSAYIRDALRLNDFLKHTDPGE